MSRVNDPLVGGIDGTSGRHGGLPTAHRPERRLVDRNRRRGDWDEPAVADCTEREGAPRRSVHRCRPARQPVLRRGRQPGAHVHVGPSQPARAGRAAGNRADVVRRARPRPRRRDQPPVRRRELRLGSGPRLQRVRPDDGLRQVPERRSGGVVFGPGDVRHQRSNLPARLRLGHLGGRAGGIGAEGLPPARPVLRQRRQVRRRGHPARTEPHVRSTARRRDRAGRRAVPHDRQWERPGSSARRRSADRGHRRRSGRSPRTGCRHRSSRCRRPSLAAQLDREHLARLDLARWLRVVGPRRQHVGWRPVRRRRARRRLSGLATGARGRRVVRLGQPRRHRDGWTCGSRPHGRAGSTCSREVSMARCGRAATPTGSGPTGTRSAVRSPRIPTPSASTRDGSTCSCAGSTTRCGRAAWSAACGRAGSRSAACSPPARPLLRRVARVDVFVRGADDALWHTWSLGAGWGPWDLGAGPLGVGAGCDVARRLPRRVRSWPRRRAVAGLVDRRRVVGPAKLG